MQRKTDRFQRIVAQAGKRIDGISPALADPMFTVKLLRRQHRLFEDAKVSAGDTAAQVELLPANAEVTGA